MSYIGNDAFKFMADLQQNNNKAWFDANRTRYEQYVRDPMKALAGALEDPVFFILPEFSGRAKVSRINNDIRFSPNKPPYKERVWISFSDDSQRCANPSSPESTGTDGRLAQASLIQNANHWMTGAAIC